MRVPPRILAVVLFVSVGIIALMVAGVLDWIVGVLFLAMEFLGEVLRGVFRRRRERRHPPNRHKHIPRRGRPLRKRSKKAQEADEPVKPLIHILVPVASDEADLLAYAIEECRTRQGELIVLFHRPFTAIPMGPAEMPGLAEDIEAQATFDRITLEADRLAVPLRTVYRSTADLPAAIGEVAREYQADVVILGSTRRNGLSRFLSRDLTPSILQMLPKHASLTIRAS